MIINYNNKEIWNLFKNEFLDKEWNILDLCRELNINKGTILRWIKNTEVPPQYFNDFNRLLDYKYSLNVDENKMWRVNDQFFTPIKEAKNLINKTINFIKNNYENINIDDYTFIEPSAGSGAFFNNIPKTIKKIGLDIHPLSENIKKQDWFNYKFASNKNIVIGNPPFGLRGQLALKFINKAAENADFICFILPPLFNSNGKGSPMLRVNKNFYLAAEFEVSDKEFLYPNGEKVKVFSIFQIWTKIYSKKIKPLDPPDKTSEWLKIYSLSKGESSSSKRNVNMIGKCDFYLPSTTFNDVFMTDSFYNLPNKRGYGVILLKDKELIDKIVKSIDWHNISFKSTNGANNLRSQLIIEAIESRI